jgi:hypothetical protein
MVGSAPDSNPPKLLKTDGGMWAWDGAGKVNATWDRPGAFGPVPDNLKAVGNRICQLTDFREAAGYHPGALDFNGQPIRGGGYLCVGRRQAN